MRKNDNIKYKEADVLPFNKNGHVVMHVFSLILFSLLIFTFNIPNVYAKTYEIALLLDPQNKSHQAIQNSFKNKLSENANHHYNLTTIEYKKNATSSLSKEYDLIISIGSRITEWAAKNDVSTQLLAVMLPSKKYQDITKTIQNSQRNFSAIVIEQPIARYFHLITAILPNITRIDSIYGRHSKTYASEMQAIAKTQGFNLHTATLANDNSIINAMQSIITNDHSVLLTLPDSDVVNKRTIRSILLHSYHKNTPVIGFSKNYVHAGALAAVFTTPTQFGVEAAKTSIDLLNKPNNLSPYLIKPSHYKIEINERVAKSMGLIIPSLTEIQGRMHELEVNQQ